MIALGVTSRFSHNDFLQIANIGLGMLGQICGKGSVMACQVICLTVGTDISFFQCSKVAIWSSSGTQYFEGPLHKFLDDSALVSWKTLTEYGKILMWQRSEIAPDEAKYSIMAKLLQFGTLIFVHTHADFDHLTISDRNPEHNNEYVLADQETSIV